MYQHYQTSVNINFNISDTVIKAWLPLQYLMVPNSSHCGWFSHICTLGIPNLNWRLQSQSEVQDSFHITQFVFGNAGIGGNINRVTFTSRQLESKHYQTVVKNLLIVLLIVIVVLI